MFSAPIAFRPGSARTRACAFALLAGVGAGVASFALFPLTHGADFAQFHFHARNWLAGQDPYAGGFPITRAMRVVPEPLFYPFPSLLALAPFALLPLRIGAAAFSAVSAGLLGYAIARKSAAQLPLFLGAGFLMALALGQWSPIVTATFLLPTLSWLAVLKPNLGLATTAAKPSWIGIGGGALLLVTTLGLQPDWPAEWIRNLRTMPGHPAPILSPGGALLLLALLRWRRPEARLIVTMACVPQLLYFADQLPLWLVPRTRREAIALSGISLVAWTAALVVEMRAGRQPAFNSSLFVLAGVYLPALVMVLRRPNEGTVPNWVERVAVALPPVLRGRVPAEQPWRA
jgi:hypothetical protein